MSQRDRPKTFSALIDALARELAVQAYDKIFFWEGGPNGTKARLDEIVQRMREGDFHQPFDSHGSSGEQLWTAVAWSNKALHGAARTWYGDGRDPRAAIREGCFGAIGSGCKGAVDFPTKDGDFTTKDGRRMNYIKLKTAIGSIAHDAQCRNIADGQWCRQDLGERFKSEDPFAKHSMGASREWDKAVTNTFTRRIWDEHYGPYPTRQTDLLLEGKSGDDITYSDDLRWHGSGRRTEVSFGAPDTRGVLVAGLKDGPGAALVKGFAEALARAEREPWHGEEIKATTRLWAPKGTNLDESDAVWCRSKKFARTNVSLWQGTCG